MPAGEAKSLKNIAKFRCDFCDKLFLTKTAILIHNKTHEIKKDLASNKDEKKEKFLCALCQKKFVYEITLNAHIKLNHQSRAHRSRKCPKCALFILSEPLLVRALSDGGASGAMAPPLF